MSVWKLLGAGILLLLVSVGIWAFVRSSLFEALLGLAVLAFLFYPRSTVNVAEEAARRQEENARRKEEFFFGEKVKITTRSDFIRGKAIARELGWVSVTDCTSTEEVERKLKAEAGKLDANGIIKFHWNPKKESFVAGRGEKGNPYYQTRTVYDGEGVAVQWRERQEHKPKTFGTTVSSGYPSGWVALDGNNIFGTIYSQIEDVEGAFRVMRNLLQKFAQSPYKAHVFWDGNFITFLNALDEKSRGKRLKEILLNEFNIGEEMLTNSRKGQRVDDLIVPWAHAKNAAIVSSDNFSKPDTDALIISKANELRSSGLLLKPNYVAGEVIVPELTAL